MTDQHRSHARHGPKLRNEQRNLINDLSDADVWAFLAGNGPAWSFGGGFKGVDLWDSADRRMIASRQGSDLYILTREFLAARNPK